MAFNISYKFGLTPTEFRLLLFVTASFLFGLALNLIFNVSNKTDLTKKFSYEFQDSLFFYNDDENNLENLQTNVASKQEVLDFNNTKFKSFSKKILPKEKSINLNTATKEQLMSLPGIGEKTAEAIINMREKIGKFRKLEELKRVKGIGDKKFETIIKYIFI
ncbi:MAG: helix-hairpin-helix domain-containing protein [Ignavibacterium sp.]|nr:helix-hairpin-helix domain-containing protein [Ignavibacterium sp.]MCX7612479.1 helix-hairpin-helix domain-containing protein [Ignavibacterium sp.]MDW8374859.1 helix-hairpin-helix domain-containing protein [Ignavibacteriales bacterium]